MSCSLFLDYEIEQLHNRSLDNTEKYSVSELLTWLSTEANTVSPGVFILLGWFLY